jgi:hypothetical protein
MGCHSEPRWRDTPVSFLKEGLLAPRPDQFADILAMADEARLKIELAIVTEGEDGPPSLERYSFDAGPDYYYPASTVKTCAAIAAALQLRELQERVPAVRELGLDAPLRFQPLFEGETVEQSDPSHLDGGTITLGHDIRKVFLVSDNAAYNHLYEFAGNAYLNETMQRAGLTSARIFHRLSEFRSPADQLRTPRIELLRRGEPIVAIPERSSGITLTNQDLSGTSIGVGHTRGDDLVEGPMSFLQKNYISLRDLQDLHIMLLRPDIAISGRPQGAGFSLRDEDRAFMAQVMAETPGASSDPLYDASSYPDDYSKFLAPGVWRVRPKKDVTIRDKVGRAYGFSTTNSEVTDHRTGRSYFLTATIYLNPNGILNDGVYDYPRADKFFADLGEVVTRHVFGR